MMSAIAARTNTYDRRYHVPRRPVRRGCAKQLVVRCCVLVQNWRSRTSAPRTSRSCCVVEPFEQPFTLFALGDVEKELEHDRTAAHKVTLEGIDVVETFDQT